MSQMRHGLKSEYKCLQLGTINDETFGRTESLQKERIPVWIPLWAYVIMVC